MSEVLDKVEWLLGEIETSPLSKTIPAILPIALECKDYIGYCILSQLTKPISDNPQTNKMQGNENIKILLMYGLSAEKVGQIMNESTKECIELKTLSKDEVSTHSVKQMEDWLPEAKSTLASITNYGNAKYKQLAEQILKVNSLYDTIRGFTISKLIYYQQTLKKIKEKNLMKEQLCNAKLSTEKVFIVHGHNDEKKESVARLIEKQGIKAIILHEQVNQGGTIIEKFERNSDVGCAIFLFTADDMGRAITATDEKKRARQNVVFEAGYFIGKLGRERVILIADSEVEMPSDLQGVVYTNSNDWRFSVLKELKAIGYKIDYEKLV